MHFALLNKFLEMRGASKSPCGPSCGGLRVLLVIIIFNTILILPEALCMITRLNRQNFRGKLHVLQAAAAVYISILHVFSGAQIYKNMPLLPI